MNPEDPSNSPQASASAANTGAQGYQRLARLMGSYSETAIFRRFGHLNMLNLMYMQAELVELESSFQRICSDDADALTATSEFTFDFKALRASADGPYEDQLKQLLIIQAKLASYSKRPSHYHQ